MDNLWLIDIPRPQPLFRFDEFGDRKYALIHDDGTIVWMPSVTAIIKATSPMAPGLLKWYADHGIEDATAMRDTAAERGTEMHIIFAKYLAGIPQDTENMTEFHAKALWSFDTFCQEWSVKPYAVEVLLHNVDETYAGTVDLVCQMTNPKTKEVFMAIIDFKSGTSSYRDHAVQLEFYRNAWNDTVICSMESDIAPYQTQYIVNRVFNWHPKDWRKTPTYTLKEQTDIIDGHEINLRTELYHRSNEVPPKPKMRFAGRLPGNATIDTYDPENVVREAAKRLAGESVQEGLPFGDPTAWVWDNPHDR